MMVKAIARAVLLIGFAWVHKCRAFAPTSQRSHGHCLSFQQQTSMTTRRKRQSKHQGLRQSNTEIRSVFEGMREFFGGGDASSSASNGKTIIDLPARNVKAGALRFVLQIQLIGQQNKPEPKTWLTKQSDDSGDLQVYYKDGTGMVTIQFQDYNVKMIRYGASPSREYIQQESVLLHSLLDELETVALGVDDIEKEKRLLVLQDDASLEDARSSLPART